jgi:dolichyl-phosphate beta-glucosyltransferase
MSELNSPATVVVVPCYNEAKRLDIRAFSAFLSDPDEAHLLFVDDGSTDDTVRILRQLQTSFPSQVSVLELKQNGGKAEAVRQGMLKALASGRATVVGYWDADLATPLDSIRSFIGVLTLTPAIQMIFGSRVKLLGRHVERRPERHYLGRVFATVASLVLRLPIYDTQCGAKLFRSSPVMAKVFGEPFISKWIFDVEIIARYIRLQPGRQAAVGQSIYEYPLEQWSDVGGSKVKPLDFVTAFFDLLKIRSKYLA